MTRNVKFTANEADVFYSTLKKRVERYFEEKGISEYASFQMILKTVFSLGTLSASYLLLLLGNFPLYVQYLLWAAVGFSTAFVAVNICHDAMHKAYSSSRRINHAFGLLFNLVGANAYVWHITHNIAHHTYPNIEGHDEDIDQISLLRISPSQPLKKVHRNQHWYAFLFYGLASLNWVLYKDFRKFFQKQIGNYDNKRHPRIEYFNLFFFKAVYYFLFLGLPLMVMEATWWQVVMGFLILHICEGFTLAVIFMMAHIVEGISFPVPGDKGRMKSSWAAHQLYTTADFATGNRVVNFLTGGLNFQVEHHLFPRICHIHYRRLAPIVRETAGEFNLPYRENKTFFGAVAAHVRLLRKMGGGAITAATYPTSPNTVASLR